MSVIVTPLIPETLVPACPGPCGTEGRMVPTVRYFGGRGYVPGTQCDRCGWFEPTEPLLDRRGKPMRVRCSSCSKGTVTRDTARLQCSIRSIGRPLCSDCLPLSEPCQVEVM